MPGPCDYWNPEECVGTPACPPRCPRFVTDDGRGLLAVHYRPDLRSDLETMYEAFSDDQRTMGIPPESDRRLRSWLDRLVDRGTNVLAVDGDAVVGHGVYSPRWEPHPEYQGRGVGTELTRQLVADAANRGLGSLRLTVDAGNGPALSVYRSLGFEVVDRRGNDVEMQLSFADPIAEAVRRPPAER